MFSADFAAPIGALRRALVEGGGKGVSLLDPLGCILRAGPGLAETLGTTDVQVVGAPLTRFLPGLTGRLPALLEESRRSGWAASWGEISAAGKRLAVSIAPVASSSTEQLSPPVGEQDSESLWVHTCGRSETDGRRTCGPCSFALFVRDESTVTEPLDQVVHQFELLRSFLSGSGDAVILLDPDLRVFGWNRAAQHVYGYTEEEVQGMSLEELLPERLRKAGELDVLQRQLMRLGTVQSYETTRVTKQGEEREIELTLSCLKNAEGECVGFSAIHRDVTVRAQLQERVVRDGQLAAIGRMATQVAHELRNPLGAIQLNVEMARDELIDLPGANAHEAGKLLDSVLSEVDLLARIVNEYLQFSRMPPAHPQALPLAELASEAADLLRGEFSNLGVSLRLRGPDAQIVCRGDRDQLYRVVVNLLRNAMEASPRGSFVDIEVVEDEGEAALRVIDEGCALTADKLDWIFEPFHTTKLSGTGLGLPLARKIIEEHGGTLSARLRKGRGMQFEIRLPIQEEDEAR